MVIELQKQAPVRTPRNSLSTDLILDAAETVSAKGFELSMREVGKELGCTPMAIYKHFEDKQKLLLALLDRVISRVEIPQTSSSAIEDLRTLAMNHFSMLQKHSWAIPMLFANPSPGPATRAIGEAFFRQLLRAGLDSKRAVIAFSTLLAFNYGWAGFTRESGLAKKMPDVIRSLPPEAEATTSVVEHLSTIGAFEDYEFALDRILATFN